MGAETARACFAQQRNQREDRYGSVRRPSSGTGNGAIHTRHPSGISARQAAAWDQQAFDLAARLRGEVEPFVKNTGFDEGFFGGVWGIMAPIACIASIHVSEAAGARRVRFPQPRFGGVRRTHFPQPLVGFPSPLLHVAVNLPLQSVRGRCGVATPIVRLFLTHVSAKNGPRGAHRAHVSRRGARPTQTGNLFVARLPRFNDIIIIIVIAIIVIVIIVKGPPFSRSSFFTIC